VIWVLEYWLEFIAGLDGAVLDLAGLSKIFSNNKGNQI